MNIYFQILTAVVTFMVILTYLSIFEHSIHRFPMHMKSLGKPWFLPLFRFLYKNHTEEHHPDFRSIQYERSDNEHHDITLLKPLLLLGLTLIGSATFPVWLIDYLSNYRFNLTWYCVPMATVYYVMFETLHVAEHKPESLARKIFGGFVWFEYLQEHHYIHHSRWGYNFNLVCPIADWIFDTMYREK
jgi:hypothetical protein